MLHLPTERLAALADEEPSSVEAEHLAVCARCVAERAVYRRLLAEADAERHRLAPPLTTWEGVSAGLRRVGVLRDSALATGDLESSTLAGESAPKRFDRRFLAWVPRVAA